ncbi:MAG: tetratricopeptide repeat protein [Promethearchaeota archaeon]|jgi:tetratricopeptide (TPR) repeat protein
MVYKEPNEITRAKELFQEGQFTEAFLLVEQFESKNGLTKNEEIACSVTKCSFYYRLGEKQEFFKNFEKINQASHWIQDDLLLIDVYLQMANGKIWYTSEKVPDYEGSLELIGKCERLLENFTQISRNEHDKRRLAIEYTKAITYNEQGLKEKVLKVMDYALPMAKETDSKVDLVRGLGMMGQIHHNNGNLNPAIKFYEQSLEIAEVIGYKVMVQAAYNGIGIIYAAQGELDLAIEQYESALAIAKEINYKFGIGAAFINLGELYQQQGKYDLAQEVLEKSFKMFRSAGSPGYTSLDSLFHLALEKGDLEGAQNYLDQLKQISENVSSANIEITYRVDRAILLKLSPRSLNRGKAEEILKEVVDGDTFNYPATLNALVNLCDLLLSELYNTGILEIIEELNSYITKLLGVAEKNQSYLVLTETYLLQSRLSLLTYDFKETRQSLIKAQEIAEKYGLSRLAVKISNEHDEFLKQQNMWEVLKQSDVDINERIELSRLNQQMDSMVHRKEIEFPRVTDEEPVVIFIFSESGEPLFSQPFTDKWKIEDHLLVGFLSAINSFSDEMFAEGFDRAIFGQYTILMVPISPFLVCYLFKGQSYIAQHRLKHFAKKLQTDKNIWDILNKFDKTSQIVELRDVPSLDPLITEIFINKVLPEMN